MSEDGTNRSSPRWRRPCSPRSISPRPSGNSRSEIPRQRPSARPPTAPRHVVPGASVVASSARSSLESGNRAPDMNSIRAGGRGGSSQQAQDLGDGSSSDSVQTKNTSHANDELARLNSTAHAAPFQDSATVFRELQRIHARLTTADDQEALKALEILWKRNMHLGEAPTLARAAGPSAVIGIVSANRKGIERDAVG